MTAGTLRGPFLLGSEPVFPHPELAHPTGLLAVGGDLSLARLLAAYSNGIFPWPFEEDEPLYWFSPDPRFVLYPDQLHVSRSLRKVLRSRAFEVRYDTAFETVIERCAGVPRGRRQGGGTWITPAMVEAYVGLHRRGLAHSAEAWCEGELAGGLYGVTLGSAFFGESMFHLRPNASKVAFATLVEDLGEAGFHFVDCQQETRHLASFGGRAVPRRRFLAQVESAIREPRSFPRRPGARQEPGTCNSGFPPA